MLGVGGVFEDGVDSAVVDALRRGRWSPGDLLSRLTLSEVLAYHTDALNNAAVEVLNIQQFNRTPIPTYCAHSNSYLVM